ncbi:lipid phosphate phosphatase beta [Pyrus ussuriensis x Pyrus communis]|uniref:Lipid phosphate phosphatase beta n=1 Tax=Pyrus ussuriensis x Pyrus communis TaxID=2448454 RepID=A0A5N5HX94_9ROSA|nr:lipid phosphate phosphatase beta [Pyrus ussuriensis x Pyrus communis]
MSVAVSVDHFSFPSGHSSRVCFVASVLHLSAAALTDALANLRSASPFVDRWIGADEVNAVRILVSVAWAWAVGTSVSRVCWVGISSPTFSPGRVWACLRLWFRFTC